LHWQPTANFATNFEEAHCVEYNTPQKLDKGTRWMLTCHIKKETEYGKEHSEVP